MGTLASPVVSRTGVTFPALRCRACAERWVAEHWPLLATGGAGAAETTREGVSHQMDAETGNPGELEGFGDDGE